METLNFEMQVDGWRRLAQDAAMIEIGGCVYNCTVQPSVGGEWRVYFGDTQVGWGVTREAAIVNAAEVLSM